MLRIHHIATKIGDRWLREIVGKRARRFPKYKQLVIFDFDGTLFRSPSPPEDYEDEEAWWSDPQSLRPPHVGESPGEDMWHPDSVERLREAVKDPEAYVVVMTGRHNSLQPRVQALLDSANLRPDELITNPHRGNTSRYKRDEMNYLFRQFPLVQEVEFWEDRKEDLKGYQRAAEKAGKRFTPKLVKNYEKETPPYIGVFLTPQAKRKVLKDFPPDHPGIQADHVTLMLKPSAEQTESFRKQFKMGQNTPIKVTGLAKDNKAQVLKVELPNELKGHAKEGAHLTVSVATGVPPSYSNELLRKGVKAISSKTYDGYLDVGPRPGSPQPSQSPATKQKDPKAEKQRLWLDFLQEETRNPELGKPGHHKERVLRKTLYDAGGAPRRQVMREWGPFIQKHRQH